MSLTKLNHFLCSMHILKRESSENVGIHLFDFTVTVLSFPQFHPLLGHFAVHEARLSKLHREKRAADGCTSS